MVMAVNVIEIKERYSNLKKRLFESINQNSEEGKKSIQLLNGILCSEEQGCLIKGIEPNNPQFFYQKSAALLYAMIYALNKKNEKKEYIISELENAGYMRDEIQKVKWVIQEKEEGSLEKKVI